ncbi:SDR family NAD(P)-dependent oxidoreductase [Mucilaginibacter dorajii]|uniref:GDP-mannose 4,6-dehydratase n=1 Tax=Mucilaginibacter dorajii TaxID=692994 RepID=A0ABP7PJU6_9SPHI|nr:SDR family NAD(P)-dependent oxidoreductase [Mucilaginibacter dorajii]MCS3733433.1 UDP-glucuronate 4-epimerase [Mucilaginibacter dorajii]
MKILVTGIAGFIGSHTGERLIKEGHHVVGIDNFDPFYSKTFKEFNIEGLKASSSFSFYETDIRDKQSLKNIFSEHNIDAVVHLAAKAGVRPSIENIEDYYDVNINGSIALLEAMRASNVKKIAFASSSSVYGNNEKVPFSESDVVDNPISPYAATKKSCELLSHVYSHLYDFDITCLRFFTVFGPRQRPDLAIHKFTRFIDQGKPIPFYGDGSTSRDYTYVADIVDGIMCALNNLDGYRIYNLGESRVIKLNELVLAIEKALGKKAVIDRKPFQPGDVEKTYANITKAKTEIGYNPTYNFQEGIQLFVDWYNQHKEYLYNN